jgi:hypothetical protein
MIDTARATHEEYQDRLRAFLMDTVYTLNHPDVAGVEPKTPAMVVYWKNGRAHVSILGTHAQGRELANATVSLLSELMK